MSEERDEGGGEWKRLVTALAQQEEIVSEAREMLERVEKSDIEEVQGEER